MLGGEACAQEAAEPAPSANDIIVTAQRRSERLVDVPATVTSVSGEQLAKSGVTSLTSLGQLAVGAKIVNFGVFLQPSIRGITTSVIGPGQENNIALYVDGFYVPDNLSLGGDLVNIEQIQVLKGPQGSLYGRSATGGALLLTTRGPSDTATGDVSASYGNLNDLRLQAFVAGPLNEAKTLQFSLSGYYRRMDGFIKNSKVQGGVIVPGTDGEANPYRNYDVRAKLKWDIGNGLDAQVGYHRYRYADNTGLVTSPYAGFPALLPSGPLRETRRDYSAGNLKPINFTRGNEYTFTLNWDTGAGTLTSRTGYANQAARFKQDQDQTLAPFSSSDANFTRKTFTQSLDFSTEAIDRLTLLAGLFYFDDRGTNEAFFENGGPFFIGPSSFINTFVFTGRAFAELRTKSVAGYADATYELIEDKLFLNVGARYNHDKKRYEATLAGQTNVFPNLTLPNGALIPMGPLFVTPKRATFNNFIPRANIRFQIDPDTNIYASFSKGFKAGTFNALNTTDTPALTAPVRPEKATSYEVGLKLRRDGFNLATAAYYTRYKDLHVNTNISDPVLGLQSALVNAASAENYGVEIEGSMTPFANFNVGGGVAYTHARYTQFPNDFTAFRSFQDSSGLRIPRAADWTANFRADYTIEGVAGGALNLGGNVSYSSTYAPNLTLVGGPITNGPLTGYVVPGRVGEEVLVQRPHAMVNLQASWTSPDKSVSVTLYGENVTNKRLLIYHTANTVTDAAQTVYPAYNRVYGRPALYGIKVGVHF